MAQVSHEKLWNKLKENNMQKTDLYRKVKIITNAIAKMGRKRIFKLTSLLRSVSTSIVNLMIFWKLSKNEMYIF